MSCSHEAAQLLPWFVTGALPAEESARVQAHLQQCPTCAADEQRERRVHALVGAGSAVEHAPQPGLQRLLARIDSLEQDSPAAPAAPAAARPATVRWLAAAVIVQAIGLGILATWLWDQGQRLQAPGFTTLSTPQQGVAQAPRLRIVFAPTMTVGEMHGLLKSIPATVVDGPSEAGVYTVAVAAEETSVEVTAARLRERDGVLFAEPQAVPE